MKKYNLYLYSILVTCVLLILSVGRCHAGEILNTVANLRNASQAFIYPGDVLARPFRSGEARALCVGFVATSDAVAYCATSPIFYFGIYTATSPVAMPVLIANVQYDCKMHHITSVQQNARSGFAASLINPQLPDNATILISKSGK